MKHVVDQTTSSSTSCTYHACPPQEEPTRKKATSNLQWCYDTMARASTNGESKTPLSIDVTSNINSVFNRNTIKYKVSTKNRNDTSYR
jgi:hypothetical protein